MQGREQGRREEEEERKEGRVGCLCASASEENEAGAAAARGKERHAQLWMPQSDRPAVVRQGAVGGEGTAATCKSACCRPIGPQLSDRPAVVRPGHTFQLFRKRALSLHLNKIFVLFKKKIANLWSSVFFCGEKASDIFKSRTYSQVQQENKIINESSRPRC